MKKLLRRITKERIAKMHPDEVDAELKKRHIDADPLVDFFLKAAEKATQEEYAAKKNITKVKAHSVKAREKSKAMREALT